MADINLSSVDSQQAAILRKRQLAQALQQQSMEPITQPQMPGAAVSNWQGIAKLVQALGARYQNSRLDKEQAALSQQNDAQRQQQAQGLASALAGGGPQGPVANLPIPQPQLATPANAEGYVQSNPEPQTSPVQLPATNDQNAKQAALVKAIQAGIGSNDPNIVKFTQDLVGDTLSGKRSAEDATRQMMLMANSQAFQTKQQEAGFSQADKAQNLSQAFQGRQNADAISAENQRTAADIASREKIAGMREPTEKTVPEYAQQLADFNAHPDLTKKYGSGPIGFMEYQQAQRIETAAASKSNPPVGDFTLKGEDFLRSIPIQWRETVKKIAKYDEDPTKVASMRGGMREQISQWVNQVNPDYDASQFSNRAPTRKAFTTGTQGQQINAINTAIGHIDMLSGLADKLQSGGFVPGNKVWNDVRSSFGNNEVTNFNTLKDALAGEVASVLSKGGATVSGIAEAKEKISSSSSPKQLAGYVETLIPVMGSKLAALDYQYHQAMGEGDSFSALSPESKAILAKRGISIGAPNVTAPKVGDKKTFPNGKVGVWDGQGYVAQ